MAHIVPVGSKYRVVHNGLTVGVYATVPEASDIRELLNDPQHQAAEWRLKVAQLLEGYRWLSVSHTQDPVECTYYDETIPMALKMR